MSAGAHRHVHWRREACGRGERKGECRFLSLMGTLFSTQFVASELVQGKLCLRRYNDFDVLVQPRKSSEIVCSQSKATDYH